MALTYPLSLSAFADKLRIVSAPFVLEEQHELSGLGSGEVLAAQLAPARWTTTVTLAPERHLKAREIQVLIESLSGSIQSFYLYCPTNCYPAKDPGGVVLGASAVKIASIGGDNKSLALNTLPANYVITAGDALAFDYGSNPTRRAWHRAAETVTANGSGVTPAFAVTPNLRPGATAGAAVVLKKPAAKMFRMPGPLSVSHTPSHAVISFEAKQRP